MIESLFPKTKRKLLGLFFRHPDEEFYRNQIIRKIGGGRSPVVNALESLTEAGILIAERRGQEIFYTANKNCPIYKDLQSLITKTIGVADILKEALEPVTGIEVAFIYGSFAKGKQGRKSDVDVMLIGDLSYSGLSERLLKPHMILRREINIAVFGTEEFKERVRNKDHFITSVLREEKIFLIGDKDDLRELAE
jgi:predicted nucleotidyltransferase